MKAGVAPSTIVEALAPSRADLERAYNPDQPRVPPGNGQVSGQWTSGDSQASDSKEPSTGKPAEIQVADASADWAQYVNPIGSAQAAESGGAAPNAQHQIGVDHAISYYESLGYQIASDKATVVDIAGFDSPRVYDFIVRDPNTENLIGVEVKTTLGDTIFLNPAQVVKDAALVATGGATTRTSGKSISGVSYMTYCAYCDKVDIRGAALYETLRLLRVPFLHQRLPRP